MSKFNFSQSEDYSAQFVPIKRTKPRKSYDEVQKKNKDWKDERKKNIRDQKKQEMFSSY